MNIHAAHVKEAGTCVQPRAEGKIVVSTKSWGQNTVLEDLHQSGSLKALFPKINDTHLQCVTVNTAGGVTGGDRFSLNATAHTATHLTLSTQAAERAYRAQAGEIGRIENSLNIQPNARIDWLPQETILFDGSAVRRKLKINMAETSRLLFVEPLVFGRLECGERLKTAYFTDRIDIQRDGIAHFRDSICLDGDVDFLLQKPSVADGATAMALLVYIAPDAEAHLTAIRDLLPVTAGVSMLHHDTLVMRALARESYELRCFLIPILNRLSANALPRPWMI